eukprot:gene15292-biopygen687
MQVQCSSMCRRGAKRPQQHLIVIHGCVRGGRPRPAPQASAARQRGQHGSCVSEGALQGLDAGAGSERIAAARISPTGPGWSWWQRIGSVALSGPNIPPSGIQAAAHRIPSTASVVQPHHWLVCMDH